MSIKTSTRMAMSQVTVAHVCDACGKEQESNHKAPSGWIEIVEYPGYADCDPETYHACSSGCLTELANSLQATTDRTMWECRTDSLKNITMRQEGGVQ